MLKIDKWGGLATAVSPYVLPGGATVKQNNLQILRPGELQTRKGMEAVYTSPDYNAVVGLYRVSNGSAAADDLVVCTRISDTQTAFKYFTSTDTTSATGWNATTATTVTTSSTAAPAFAEDRYGRIYAFSGNGVSPIVIDRSTKGATTIGLSSPTIAPVITPSGNGYFIERVDVLEGGGSYWAPPPIVISGGGSPLRAARLKTIIQGGSVTAVDVIDGGTGYASAPTLTVNETGIKGAGFLGYGIIGVDPGIQGFQPVITATGNLNSTATVSSVTNVAQIKVGMSVTGTGIPAGVTVTAVNTTNATITLSSAATSTASAVALTINEGTRSGTTNSSLSHGYSIDTSSTSIAYTFTASVTTANTSYILTGVTNPALIQIGALITGTGIPANTTVTAVNVTAATVTISAAATANGTVTATITQGASASFDSTSLTYSALIPLTPGTNSSTGAKSAGYGASARVTFGMQTNPSTFTYKLGGTQDSSWPVKPSGAAFGTATSTLYTSNDYFVNTDTNTQYPRDQTASFYYYDSYQFERSNTDFFAAFTPDFQVRFHGRAISSTGKDSSIQTASKPRYTDLYMLDYTKVSFRYYTGSRAELETATDTEDKWVWAQATVQVLNGQPFIDVKLTPAKKTSTTNYTTFTGYSAPTVRIYLKYCPDSWINGANDNVLNLGWRRTNGATRPAVNTGTMNYALGWWCAGNAENGPAPRPIVDFRAGSGGSDAAGITANTVQILDAGSGMEQGTFFAIQFDQVNANNIVLGQTGPWASNYSDGSIYRPSSGYPSTSAWNYPYILKNPVSPQYTSEVGNGTSNTAALTKTFGTYRQRLYFWANLSAPPVQGPPAAVTGSPSVAISGTGFLTNDQASFTLRQRSDLTSSATFSDSYTYTFKGVQITPATATQTITGVTIVSGGTNYYGVPELEYAGGGGYGLELAAIVSGGAITGATVLSSGSGFTSVPTVTAGSQTAKLIPIMRPAMRGTYRCAYRFADWSKTRIGTLVVTTTAGSTTATVTDASTLAPDIVLESDYLPFMTKIVSMRGTTLTLSQAALTTGATTTIVRDMTKPIFYSNFSPIKDIDTTQYPLYPNPTTLTWNIDGASPPDRANFVEFFRTSSDQSLVFYRLEMYGKALGNTVQIVGTDTMTDEELFNPDRPFYAAIPVVLPNGGLNAYRFGVPRTDMAVGVAYGDRLWYGVSTSGLYTNSVFYSEYDEFESCPLENELAIQNNQKSTDSIVGLIPFGTYLLIFQNSHCYGLSYNTDPGTDASIQFLAHRGILSQTCHDLFDNRLFAADERGVYVMERDGGVESLSDAIRNYFGLLDFSYRKNFFLKVDQRTSILRLFVVVKGSGATTPNMALCYNINLKCWWTETWPNGMVCGTDYRRTFTDPDQPIYGAVDGDIYRSTGVRDTTYRAIRSVTVTNGGSGYVTPPTVSVASGQAGGGASFTALITNGAVTEILVDETGFGYGSYSGSTFNASVPLTISAPSSGVTATATATCDLPVQADGSYPQTSVAYAIRTGTMELSNEDNSRLGDAQQDRAVSVIYRPTTVSCVLNLREFFNNSQYPRQNVMPRNRGTGFIHDTSGAKTYLDMAAARSSLGTATGVARAQFAGRNFSDMAGADRHVAVELSGAPVTANSADQTPPEILLYGLEVAGVVGDGD